MKKMLLALGLILSFCFSAKAQVLTITNNTNCTIDYIAWAIDQGGACRGNSYYVGINVVPPMSTITVDATTPGIWNGTAPTGPVSWAGINFYCHLPNTSCHNYGGPVSCPLDAMIMLGGACTATTSGCMRISDVCSGCPVGTQVNGTWTNTGGGNATIVLN